MDLALWIGSVGVFLLLLAFVLNLSGRLPERSRCYLLLNLTGASMAAWYAWAGSALPFVLLEGIWATVSAVRLIGVMKSTGLTGPAG